MNKILIIKYNQSIENKDVLDISDVNIPVLREFTAFKTFVKQAVYKQYEYCGIVSPKFTNKTGLTIEQALAMIDEEYDVILFHPYPLELRIQSDFLQLAELEHPGIRSQMQRLWSTVYDGTLPMLHLNGNLVFCVHCNYIVATRKFWDMYAEDIEIIDQLITQKKIESMFDETSYYLSDSREIRLAMFPFIFERYLSHYLYKHQDSLRIKNISLDPSFRPIELFKFEKKLIAMLGTFLCLKWIDERTIKKVITYIYFVVRRQLFHLRRIISGEIWHE